MKPFNTTDNCNIDSLVNTLGASISLFSSPFVIDVRALNPIGTYSCICNQDNMELLNNAEFVGLIIYRIANDNQFSNMVYFTKHKEACETFPYDTPSIPNGWLQDAKGYWVLPPKLCLVSDTESPKESTGIGSTTTGTYTVPAADHNPKYYGDESPGKKGWSTFGFTSAGLGNKSECSCEYCTRVKELKVLVEEKMSRSDDATALYSQLVAYLNTQP